MSYQGEDMIGNKDMIGNDEISWDQEIKRLRQEIKQLQDDAISNRENMRDKIDDFLSFLLECRKVNQDAYMYQLAQNINDLCNNIGMGVFAPDEIIFNAKKGTFEI